MHIENLFVFIVVRSLFQLRNTVIFERDIPYLRKRNMAWHYHSYSAPSSDMLRIGDRFLSTAAIRFGIVIGKMVASKRYCVSPKNDSA